MQTTSLRAPTKYEAERIEAMLRLGCCCCAQLALWNVAECQHIVEGNRRLGHWYTLPICPGHHRGVWTEEQIETIPAIALVAISDGSKAFKRVYGTQREMWVRVQLRLKLPAVWPSSKILPRSQHVGLVATVPGETALKPLYAPGPTAGAQEGPEPGAATGDRA